MPKYMHFGIAEVVGGVDEYHETRTMKLVTEKFDAPDDAAAAARVREIRSRGHWMDPLELYEIREVKVG